MAKRKKTRDPQDEAGTPPPDAPVEPAAGEESGEAAGEAADDGSQGAVQTAIDPAADRTAETPMLEEEQGGQDGGAAPASEIEGERTAEQPLTGDAADEEQAAAPEGSTQESAEESAEESAVESTDEALGTARSGESDGVVLSFTEAAAADQETPPADALDIDRVASLIESLLFAADRALTMTDLKRLLDERSPARIEDAMEVLRARQTGTGLQIVGVSGGYSLRTAHANAAWVGKLLVGKPVRLSRAMLETLAIIAYRQPITRPEIDDIRGVDCGPVLKTLLDRNLIRVIGKKEEVGRPLLYGTTPDFLKTFNLRDLTELPTLREFHELGDEEAAKVRQKHPSKAAADAAPGEEAPPAPPASNAFAPSAAIADRAEDEGLLDELDRAAEAAARALGAQNPPDPSGPA